MCTKHKCLRVVGLTCCRKAEADCGLQTSVTRDPCHCGHVVAPVTLNLAAVADHVVWSLAAARPALAVNRRAASWRFRSPDKRPGFASSAPVAQTRLASENRPVLQAPDAETIVTQTVHYMCTVCQHSRVGNEASTWSTDPWQSGGARTCGLCRSTTAPSCWRLAASSVATSSCCGIGSSPDSSLSVS